MAAGPEVTLVAAGLPAAPDLPSAALARLPAGPAGVDISARFCSSTGLVCSGPVSGGRHRDLRARSAVDQPSPPAFFSAVMRAVVIMPRYPDHRHVVRGGGVHG